MQVSTMKATDNLVFYLVQNSAVLRLWNADKLAIINLCVHRSIMVQLLHCWRNPKTITKQHHNHKYHCTK